MPAYYKNTLLGFLKENQQIIKSVLTSKYVNDGYYQLLGTQSKSWEDSLPIIYNTLNEIYHSDNGAGEWGVLLEYPLYRLRKRIDLIIVSTNRLYIVELKVGATEVESADIRQVEDYALDLRDFHKASHSLSMSPILCCTELSRNHALWQYDSAPQVQPVCVTSKSTLAKRVIQQHAVIDKYFGKSIDWKSWEQSSYEPVPTIIEAATVIFTGHSVKEISRSDADNLQNCSQEVVRLIHETRDKGKKRIIVVTGIPGAGKTLAGLNVVHQTKDEDNKKGKVIYLSGNTPLIIVIREALAQDEYNRSRVKGNKRNLGEIRHKLLSRIQHINDFLKEYYSHDLKKPPFENAIVFDEAQRAWDHKQGKIKFNRDASEPELLMSIMDRHKDWAAIVCLVGAGQEINVGEPGMEQWGEAVAKNTSWELIAHKNAVDGSEGTAGTALFAEGEPAGVRILYNDALRLNVSIRSYRSEMVSEWVDAVLENRPKDARQISEKLGKFPITLVRSINECRELLKKHTRGTRRCGLLASSGASRLVAEGLGVSLNVQEKSKIAHWYLKPHKDYRSSNSLEVAANEYTSQGLELDYTGICWGGDFVRETGGDWCFRRLHRTTWQNIHNADTKRYILNKYRVFLTRSREGMVLFVPRDDSGDSTRVPGTYDAIASYLKECGVAF
jgi:DUF2075 family protein